MKTVFILFLIVTIFSAAVFGSENLKLAAGSKTLDELVLNLKKFNEELKTSPEAAKRIGDEFIKMLVASYTRLFEAGEYRRLIFLCEPVAEILNNGDIYHICAKPHCQLGESDSCRRMFEKYLEFHKGNEGDLKTALAGITTFLIDIYRLEDAYFFQRKLEDVESNKTSAKLQSAELLLKLNRKDEADKIYKEILAGIQSKEERLKAAGEIGKKLMQYHAHDKALFFYQEVLKENPKETAALFAMIKIHYALKNDQVMISLVKNFLEGSGYSEDVVLKIANFLEFEPSRTTALAVLKTASQKRPESMAIKFSLGKALYESGKKSSARKILNGLVRTNAEYAEKVSDFYLEKNDRKSALGVYKQIKVTQENYKTKLREIALMAESGMFKEAAREVDNGAKALKEPGAFLLEAGRIFYKSKKNDTAKKFLLKGIASDVTDRKLLSESYFLLANIEIASQKMDRKAAESYLENYLKFADFGESEMDKAIEICRNSKFENLAVKILEKKIEKSPENCDSYLELAELRILQNEPTAAMELLTKYTALSDNKITAINRAISVLVSGGMGGLEPEFLSALEDKKISDPLFDAYLGQIFLGKGNLLKAARHLWKFILAPENKSPQQLNLVDELASRGLTSAAAALLSGIIPSINDAEREGANLALGRLLILSGNHKKGLDVLKKTVESSQNPDTAKFKAAKILYETGRLQEAEKLCAGFLSGNIKEAGEAAKMLADIYVRTGNRKNVIGAVEKLAKMSDNREEALELSAEILSNAGFHDQAVKYLDEAISINPSKRQLHEKKASELLKAKKFEEAAAKFMDILNVYGGGGTTFEQIGRLFEALSRDKEAMLFYDRGIEKGEKTAQIFLARGNLKRKRGEFASAHKDSMMAIDYAGKPEEVLNGLRDSYFSVNDLKRYIEILNYLSSKFPARDRLTVETGIILMKLGNKTDGLNLVNGVLKTTREDPFYIYRLLLEIGEDREAGKMLIEMAEMPPDRFSPDNAYEMAMSLIQNGDGEVALKFIDRLANGDDSTAGNKNTAADILHALGKYREALKYKKAACAQIKEGNCPLALGKLEYLAGNTENALKEFSAYIAPAGYGPSAEEGVVKYDEAINAVFSFLSSHKDYETSLRFIEAASKRRESRATIFYRLKSLVILGMYQDAASYLKNILNRQNIEYFADSISIMRHLILKGQAEVIEKLISETGDLKPLYDLWYSCTVKGGETLTKEGINASVAELVRLLPGIDFRLGEILFDCGKYELATGYFLDSLRGEERQFLQRNLEMLFKSDAAAGKKASIKEAMKILDERFDDLLFVRETLANAAYSAGFYSDAVEIYKDLSKYFPDNQGLLLKIFRTCVIIQDKCDLDEAEENYVAASENMVRALETVFSIYREQRKFREAKDAISRISQLYPSNYQYLYNSLRMLILAGDVQGVKETGKKFIEASADRIEALMDIYSLYTELGYMSDGSELLDEIEKGDSLKYRRNYLEGIRKFRSGEIDKAKELFSLAFESGNCPEKEKYKALMPFIIAYDEVEWLRKQASALSKKSPQGILIRAGVEILYGNAGEAERLIEEYVGIGLNATYGMNLLGIAATSAGNYDLAIKIYEKSLKFDPSNENIGVIITQIGDFAGSNKEGKLSAPAARLISFGISLCDKVLSSNPFDPSILTYKAEFLHFLGKEKLADEIIEQVFKVAPHSPTLFNNYAYVLAKQGRLLDEALNYAKKAIQLQPTQGIYYYDTLGWVYYMMGNLSEALKWIKKSESLLTEREVDTAIEVYYHLGLVYKKLGRQEDALKTFYEAARLNPISSYGMRSLDEIKKLKEGE